jgi:hypothetical protein
MQPPNAAIIRPLDTLHTLVLLSQQNWQHTLDSDWWENTSHHWWVWNSKGLQH